MKKNIVLALVFLPFCILFAQDGVFEIGLNYGINKTIPVNFYVKNNRVWDVKTALSSTYGFTLGYQSEELYTLRLGFYSDKKVFTDSTIICGIAYCFPYKNQFSIHYISVPLVNELHLYNNHLIFMGGLDMRFLMKEQQKGLKRDFGIIVGLATQFDVTQRLKWRLESKFNRGFKGWNNEYSDFSFDRFDTFNVSTGLIYALKKMK